MTDKHLNENSHLMHQAIHVALILTNVFPIITAFQHKIASLFSDIMLLFLNGYHGNNKNISHISDV